MTRNGKLVAQLALFALLVAPSFACELPEPDGDFSSSRQAVINGADASRAEYPWQAIVIYDNSRMCGGTLLSDEWVLTAGHCLAGRSPADFLVGVGKNRLGRYEYGQQVRSVASYVMHPDFTYFDDDLLQEHNDVALIKLDSPVQLSRYVQPIRLATGNDGPGVQAWISGWGRTESDDTSPAELLQEAMLPVRDNAVCDAVPYPTFLRDTLENELCAGYSDGYRSTCHGDSGGPLAVRRSSGTWELIGIVTWGHENVCGSYSVFARVSSFVDWIRRVIDEPTPPQASFSFIASGLAVDFRDQSTDADGTVVGWRWDFDDRGATSSRRDPTHTFSADGTYQVRLTVTDNDGAVDTVVRSVRVEQSTDEELYTGMLANGDWEQQPDGTYYRATAGDHIGRLVGPAGTDFNLYLFQWSASSRSWRRVASSTGGGAQEQILYSGDAGYYTWVVQAGIGSGRYELGLTRP